ncbi:MAG: hypothetical protein SangKO_044880 [Sandaracinaceae bacterium]
MSTRYAHLLLALLSACAAPPSPDGEHDPAVVPGGKADGSDYESCELDAVVALLNEGASAADLQASGLHARAANNLTAHRDGADARFGTADDDLFDDIEEVDAVSWVGPVALRQLVALVEPCEDLGQIVPDVLHTSLEVDVSSLEATAGILVDAPAVDWLVFDATALDVRAVRVGMREATFSHEDGWLFVELPAGVTGETWVTVEYGFAIQEEANGLLPNGSTLVWPYFCGNLFPCNPDPSEGMTYTLDVRGASGEVVATSELENEGPAYMIGWAAGDYRERRLGRTPAGTDISVWYFAAQEEEALRGTEHLVDAFDFLERSYGPYFFGASAGSVQADWGPSGFGGMEHHPFWHVGTASMDDFETHAHEAAHGWYGNGVRIACWEDFVLSEGVTTYLAARAVEAAAGEAEAAAVWEEYREELDATLADPDVPHIAWPEGCGEVDLIEDAYWTSIPYMKGALFFRALERRIGRPALDTALRDFYLARRGTAARFADLLDAIASGSGYDPLPCAEAWLQQDALPSSEACE